MSSQVVLPAVILYKAIIGLAATGVAYLMTYPFRFIMKEWRSLKTSISGMHSELVQQRSNHLEHIQDTGQKQVELLTKVCGTLDGVRIELATQTGFLQAAALPRRATKK